MMAGHRFAQRVWLPVLLIVLSLLAMAGLVRAQQEPTLESCNYDVGAGVPFVLLHFESSTQSAVAFTVYQGQTLFTIRRNSFFWDGSEWWVEVWTGLPNAKGTYWAEFDRLSPRCQPNARPQPIAPAPNPEPARWFPGEAMVVRATVDYVLLRGNPSPTSAAVRTIYAGGGLLIEQQDAARDNLGQWWWVVRDPLSGEVGWVEQAALEPGALPPTPTPLPTLDLPTLPPPVEVLPTDAVPVAPTDVLPTDIPPDVAVIPTVELLPTDVPPVFTLEPTVDLLTLIPTVDVPTETPAAIAPLVPTNVAPTFTPTDLISLPGVWKQGDRVRIHPGIPYSWLRIIPSSESAWTYAVTRQELVILGGPQSDGVQNWWNVAVPSVGANVVGWVEENALELIGS